MKIFRTKLNSRGDTIVEVMIVLAILSMSFGISYATANGSLIRSRNSEEHTEAQGILSSQAESLRAAVSNNVTLPSNSAFCFAANSGNGSTNDSQLVTATGTWTIPSDPASDNLSVTTATPPGPYPTGCFSSIFYYSSIVYVNPGGSAQPYYDIRVRWQGLGTLGVQQVEYTYAITPSSVILSGGSGGSLPGYIPCTTSYLCNEPPAGGPNAPSVDVSIPSATRSGANQYIFIAKNSNNLDLNIHATADQGTTTTCTVDADSYTYSFSSTSNTTPHSEQNALTSYINKSSLTSPQNQPLTFNINCSSQDDRSGYSSSQSTVNIKVYVEQPFYRMYNAYGDHFYTASPTERDNAENYGWALQSIAGYIDQTAGPGEVALYRMNNSYGSHFYATDDTHSNNLNYHYISILFGYYNEGIAGYVFSWNNPQCSNQASPWYWMDRTLNGNTLDKDQFFTNDTSELNSLTDKIANINGYNYEDIAACLYE